MVSSLAERFRRAVLSDDLASAKVIAKRAFSETCNDAHPFDIRNQTVLRAGQSHHSSSSASSNNNNNSSTSSSTSSSTGTNISANCHKSILPALSASQHQFARQSRGRERNRQAGRCKSSLVLAIENEASIDMIQWILDMGHERGQYSRDFQNCTMVSLAAQYNRTDVIEALCIDAVANAASEHHQRSLIFDNHYPHMHQDDDDDEEGRYGEEVDNSNSTLNPLDTSEDAQEESSELDNKVHLSPPSNAQGGEEGKPRSSMDKELPSLPTRVSHHKNENNISEFDNTDNSRDSNRSETDLVGKELLHLLDSPDELGRTALALASIKGYQDIIVSLLDLGANINLADYEGNTPLHYASSYNHLLAVQLLIERGCAFATKNSFGFTAADYAYTSSLKGALEAFARGKFERDRKGNFEGEEDRIVKPNQKAKHSILSSAKAMQSSLQYRLNQFD